MVYPEVFTMKHFPTSVWFFQLKVLRFIVLLIVCAAVFTVDANLPHNENPNFTEILTLSQATKTSHLETQSNLTVEAVDTMALSVDLEQLMNEAAEDIPNLRHYVSLIPNKSGSDIYHSECATFPAIPDLEFSNTFWQVQETSNRTIFLYSAHYDNRTWKTTGHPTVRIIVVTKWMNPNPNTTWCQLWFENENNPVISRVVEKFFHTKERTRKLSPKRIKYNPKLYGCEVPESHHDKIPISVSIVEVPCQQATNNLRVVYENSGTRDAFAVCVKGLDFAYIDISVQLIEWIELLNIIGVHKIFFYQLAVHPNITKVLSYYASIGKVHVTPITLPGHQPNEQRLQTIYLKKHVEAGAIQGIYDAIFLNNCLYRNLYEYDFVVPIDIDEMILPTKGRTWHKLVEQLISSGSDMEKDKSVSYYFDRLAVDTSPSDAKMEIPSTIKSIPAYQHMLRAVYPKAQEERGKSFVSTKSAIAITPHRVHTWVDQQRTMRKVKTNKALCHHFRSTCVQFNRIIERCNNPSTSFAINTNIWKYSDELVFNTKRVMRLLGFLS